jgi:acetyltransferase-like isoleucine patch superfamily enzyme
MDPRTLAKRVLHAASTGAVAPLIALYKLESLAVPDARRDPLFQGYSQALALVPGFTGQYLRRAFYAAVLESCDIESCVQWGTILSSTHARIGRGVYVGARCMLGRVHLDDHATLGSNVDILSGKNQHGFDDPDVPVQDQPGRYEVVRVGTNTWIGNGAVVLADVGARSVVAAGAVVTAAVPDDAIVGGNPARVLKRRDPVTRQWVKPE